MRLYHSVHLLHEICIFAIMCIMVEPKRSLLCPGCKAPKNKHSFATPSKHCAGPFSKHEIPADEDVISEDGASPPCLGVASPPAISLGHSAMQLSLLDAMRNLSLQLEVMWNDQAAMKQRMDESPPNRFTRLTKCLQGLPIMCFPLLATIFRGNLSQLPLVVGIVFGDRSFSVAAPTLWNNLPASLRSMSSISSFRSQLKTHLFRLAFNSF